MGTCFSSASNTNAKELSPYTAAVAKIRTCSSDKYDAAAAANACLEFKNLYKFDEAKTALAHEAGGVEVLLGALRANKQDATVHHHSLNALYYLAGIRAACDEFRACGGTELLVDGMRGHAEHTDTQQCGCDLVGRIASNGGTVACTELLSAGTVEVVLGALHIHAASHPNVTIAACLALSSLASNGGDACRSAVLASGALKGAHAAVGVVPADHSMTSTAERALATLEGAL